jgi:hypothetical protein
MHDPGDLFVIRCPTVMVRHGLFLRLGGHDPA